VSEVVVVDNPAESRYEAHLDGALAGFAVYRRSPGAITFVHTVVQPAYEGHGVGGAVARTSLDLARAAGETVVAQCPFYAGWISKHPDYQDLLTASA
jgi:predicted GNAT family acetyltransferase